MSYTITYNGRTAEDIGLVVEHRPSIPGSVERIEEIEVPGRDGYLYRRDGTVDAVEIPIELAFYTQDENLWMQKFREITAWLYGSVERKLYLSDDPDWFYKVKKVEIADNVERILWNGGRITATFTCDGYAYSVVGESTAVNDYTNNYDLCHPLYVLTGDVLATLTINGQQVKINVGGEVTIDTDLQIAYRSNGSLANTDMQGYYEDMWLNPGENTISVSGSGVNLAVYPRWRKRL